MDENDGQNSTQLTHPCKTGVFNAAIRSMYVRTYIVEIVSHLHNPEQIRTSFHLLDRNGFGNHSTETHCYKRKIPFLQTYSSSPSFVHFWEYQGLHSQPAHTKEGSPSTLHLPDMSAVIHPLSHSPSCKHSSLQTGRWWQIQA